VGRLAKFPDAWLLPLFPLLIRILYMTYQSFGTAGFRLVLESWAAPIFRRLCLYVLLMNFRGWALYIGFNRFEDHLVTPISETCWYRDWLREGQSPCYGRVFDFSDHVVLYFGQILPIALIEVMHALEQPYWRERFSLRTMNKSYTTSIHYLPISLVAGLLYLHFVTYVGAYITTSYFHTFPEVFAGFLISLLIHVPLGILQCHERCEGAREFFFGSPPSQHEQRPKVAV
jgi:hypothetical protein